MGHTGVMVANRPGLSRFAGLPAGWSFGQLTVGASLIGNRGGVVGALCE